MSRKWRGRIALAQLHQRVAIAGQILAVGIVVLGGIVASGLEARAIGLIGKAETHPQIMLDAVTEQEAQRAVQGR